MAQPVKRAPRGARAAAAPAKVRTFAPSAEEPAPHASAGVPLERCPGCAHLPCATCAACGGTTAYALEVGGEIAHALTLCAACHAVLLEVRDRSAEPLQYLPLLTLQTKQAQRKQRRPSTKQPRQPKPITTPQPAQRAQGGAA